MTSVHAVHDTERHASELQARALRDRIHACVPVTGQAFAKLLSLLSIEVSDEIPTASVTTGARSSMLVNPEFVARHCRTDEHLSMLVLHELYHVLLGHTRLYPRATPAQNWAFDCLINAQLCRLFPSARYTTFFTQFTQQASGPVVLLAPPPGWDPDPHRPHETRAQQLVCYGEGSAALLLEETHWRLYSDESVTTEELYRWLERAAVAGELENAPLLGNHDPTGTDVDATLLHPDALREIRDIVARWPMIELRSGRDQGGEMRRDRITLAERRSHATRVLRRAIAQAASRSGSGLAQRTAATTVPTLSPFDRGHDRRAAVQRVLGFEPLLWSDASSVVQRSSVERVRVYLDLSGSMSGVLPALYAALVGCLDLVEPVVLGFSTGIAPLTHAQLRAGVRLSTGGTDIDAVTDHLLDAGVRHALVVTDGWVGKVPDEHRHQLARRGVKLVVAITDRGDASFAERIGAPVHRLPPLDA
ncbi:MAG: VWA domain-containing protein [Burkholderiaceae bacterium]|nr:VWA domain-containing protein [Burkholderiaceae bacterium]